MVEVRLPKSTFEEGREKGELRLVWRDTITADFSLDEVKEALRGKFRRDFKVHVSKGALHVEPGDIRVENFLKVWIQSQLGGRMVNRHTGRRMIYIGEGVPLLGYNAFGLIDRGTNLIQVRGISGCNLSCIFCSVDEGPYSRTRRVDYVVDVDVLADWFRKVAGIKGDGLEAHLDGQGEPLTYPFIVELVQALREIPEVRVISMQSNGTLLNDRLVEELAEAGLDRMNLSIHSLNPDKAKMLMGRKDYNLEHVLEMAEALLSAGVDVMVAPVIIFGVNDDEAGDFIELAKKLGAGRRWPPLGFQNYVPYRFGRKPTIARPVSFREFYSWLGRLEEVSGVKPLILKPRHFGMERRPFVPLVFRTGEIVKIRAVLPGRIEGEVIGTARNRLIEVVGSNADVGDRMRVRIVRTRHGIYVAVPA